MPKEREGEESPGYVWTLISNACEKYQVSLASVITCQVHNPDQAKTLSKIPDLVEKSGPKKALETMLGGSAPKFFSLFVSPTGLCFISSFSPGYHAKAGRCC